MSNDVGELPATQPLPEGQWLELSDGSVVHHEVAGPPDGDPVILLHGGLPGSSGWAGWRFLLPALAADGFRVYAPDRPGFGRADVRPEHWPTRGFMSWADFVGRYADALDLDDFHLAGNSQGAQTAAYFAVREPERVRRMVLIACGGFNAALDIPTEQLRPGIAFPTWDGTEASMRSMLETIVFRTAALDGALVAARNEAALRQRDAFTAAATWNKRATTDPGIGQLLRLTGHLDQLTVPMIYLYGRQDVLGPVDNAFLQEDRLPNVQFFYPDQCGHQGQTDRPELFHRVFRQFLGRGVIDHATAMDAGVSRRRPRLPVVEDAPDGS